MVAYSVYRGDGSDEVDDHFYMESTLDEAKELYHKVIAREDIFCAAISIPIEATEPQYVN